MYEFLVLPFTVSMAAGLFCKTWQDPKKSIQLDFLRGKIKGPALLIDILRRRVAFGKKKWKVTATEAVELFIL